MSFVLVAIAVSNPSSPGAQVLEPQLKVPVVHEFRVDGACGAAALVMVYSYYNVTVTQEELFQAYAQQDPKDGSYAIYPTAMVGDAQHRCFSATSACLNLDDSEGVASSLAAFIARGIPLIVLQRYAVSDTNFGHYRVVVGLSNGSVMVNDPAVGTSFQVWVLSDFIAVWREVHGNLYGSGIYVAIWK
jgi:predicted double-glycine peptidase